MCNECGDQSHWPNLFGGPLAVERINATLKAFKAQGIDEVDLQPLRQASRDQGKTTGQQAYPVKERG